MNAEFILTGTPPGCCPCPPCPDCPSGVWIPEQIASGVSFSIVLGYGLVIAGASYRCPILGQSDVLCSVVTTCKAWGALGEASWDFPFAVGVKCTKSFTTPTVGFSFSIPIKGWILGPGGTITWGGGAYYITPGVGAGGGGAWLHCTPQLVACEGPCPDQNWTWSPGSP